MIENKNFEWFLVRDNFLTLEECDKEIQFINKSIEDDNYAWGSLHNCKNVDTENDKLLDRLWKVVKLSNTLVYKFDISGIQHSCGKLYPVDTFIADDKYHTDFAAGDGKVVNSCTKLTTVIFLNDDFEGGGLKIWNQTIEPKKGRLVIFPSFAAHKVLQFSEKDRYTLITFIEGNTFK